MKLLTSTSGWVSMGGRLFTTTDLGEHWKEITPKNIKGGFSAVTFTSIDQAWLLYIDPVEDDENSREDWKFRVAHTSDGGATWTQAPVPLIPADNTAGGSANFAFSDNLHGWFAYNLTSGSAFSEGVLLTTLDGGQTWKQAGTPASTVNCSPRRTRISGLSAGLAGMT